MQHRQTSLEPRPPAEQTPAPRGVRDLTPAEQRQAEAAEQYYRELENQRLAAQIEASEQYCRELENERLIAGYDAARAAAARDFARRWKRARGPRAARCVRARPRERRAVRRRATAAARQAAADDGPAEPEPDPPALTGAGR